MKIINPKLTKRITFFLVTAVLVSSITSCIKDNFEFDKLTAIEWNPNLAVPLVYSSLSIKDMLAKNAAQGLIVVGSDDFCTLVYRSNLFSLVASEVITIPNNQPPPFSAALSSGQISAFGLAGTITVPYSQTITFDSGVNGPKIDSLFLKTGTIDISLSSDFKYNGQIKIILPAAKKNGVVFSHIIPFSYTGTVPVLANATLDLAGYRFDMTNGGTAFNEFVANFEVTLSGSGTPIAPSDQITLSQSLNNMTFSKIFGDIGQISLSPDVDSVDIGIFKNVLGTGSFTLADPKIKVIISNSYGVPIQANMSQFEGYTPGGIATAITGSPNPLPIQSPTFSQIGQVLTDSFSLNNTNSNIASIINNTPKYLIYKINSQTNPAGGTTHNNFVLDTSRFNVGMEVELPLHGTATNFVLLDTIPFEFGSTLPKEVESALIRTYNSNGFPFDVNMQVYFTDSLYTKLDSLVIPNQLILQSGIVNSTTGMVTAPTSTTYDAVLTKSRLDNLATAKYLLVKAIANTTNGGATNVKIYTHYKVDLKLGLQVQIKAKF
ncbi:MAG: hypothetical protein V4608_05335 [Bacteroidota bacterium]